jgi:hypothetical protein
MVLREARRLDFMLCVLETLDVLSIVEKIEELTTVYFKTTHKHLHISILRLAKISEYISSR